MNKTKYLKRSGNNNKNWINHNILILKKEDDQGRVWQRISISTATHKLWNTVLKRSKPGGGWEVMRLRQQQIWSYEEDID